MFGQVANRVYCLELLSMYACCGFFSVNWLISADKFCTFCFLNCYKALLKESTVVLNFYLCISTFVMKTVSVNPFAVICILIKFVSHEKEQTFLSPVTFQHLLVTSYLNRASHISFKPHVSTLALHLDLISL